MNPDLMFKPGIDPGDVIVKADRSAFEFTRVSDMKVRPAHWIVRKLLERDCIALDFGDPGCGKSFVAYDMGCCIATDTEFHGHKVKQGAVFIIAGEGFNGIQRRLRAWEIVRGVSLKDAPLFISRTPAALCDPGSTEDVATAIRTLASDTGIEPTLIIIDTATRNFGPGDENSTRDMGQFIASLDALRVEWGAAILVVHHSGHGDKTRARGAMALRGAVDFEYRVDKDENGVIRLECTKCKDHDHPKPIAFRLASVDLGIVDEDGQPVTSAALTSCEYIQPVQQSKTGRGSNQTKALQILHELRTEHQARLEQDGREQSGARVLVDDWKQRCIEGGIDRKRWPEVRQSLQDSGQIRIENGYVTCPK